MPDFDDRLRRELERATKPADPAGAYERVASKRLRRHLARRFGTAMLAVAVLSGTGAGTWGLFRVFGSDTRIGGEGGGGVIAFVRVLRSCPGYTEMNGPSADVFAVTPDGREQWDLTEGSGWPDGSFRGERNPAFSPDGTRFAWLDQYRGNLYLTDLRTGETDKLTDGMQASSPSWAPDGTRLAFAATDLRGESDGGVVTFASSIYSIRPDGSDLTRLASSNKASDDSPEWSPDGARIAFLRMESEVRREGDILTITFPGPQTLWLMNADGSDQRKIEVAPPHVWVAGGEWSPDGERFVAEGVVNGNHDIYVANIDDRTGLRLTDDPAQDTSPSWSPDGTKIAFHTGRWGTGIGHSEIATIDADGTGLTRITNDCWDDVEPTWVKDASTITRLPRWTPDAVQKASL